MSLSNTNARSELPKSDRDRIHEQIHARLHDAQAALTPKQKDKAENIIQDVQKSLNETHIFNGISVPIDTLKKVVGIYEQGITEMKKVDGAVAKNTIVFLERQYDLFDALLKDVTTLMSSLDESYPSHGCQLFYKNADANPSRIEIQTPGNTKMWLEFDVKYREKPVRIDWTRSVIEQVPDNIPGDRKPKSTKEALALIGEQMRLLPKEHAKEGQKRLKNLFDQLDAGAKKQFNVECTNTSILTRYRRKKYDSTRSPGWRETWTPVLEEGKWHLLREISMRLASGDDLVAQRELWDLEDKSHPVALSLRAMESDASRTDLEKKWEENRRFKNEWQELLEERLSKGKLQQK